jgi:hypothetical protein
MLRIDAFKLGIPCEMNTPLRPLLERGIAKPRELEKHRIMIGIHMQKRGLENIGILWEMFR